MTSKGPFQPKLFYDFMMFLLVSKVWMIIRDQGSIHFAHRAEKYSTSGPLLHLGFNSYLKGEVQGGKTGARLY